MIKPGVKCDENYIRNYIIDHTNVVYAKNESELHNRSDQVQCVTKRRQDNDKIDCNGAIYAKNETELLRLIRLAIV